MKREFGLHLIENFLAHQDLRLVADTSGAYIPGHGTPTVILVGRNQRAIGSTVRAVLGIRGESDRPDDAANGIVWTSIVEHVDDPNWDDGWVTVTDLDRTLLSTHPWSLSGGGAVELMEAVASAGKHTIADVIAGKVGFASFSGADDVFFAPHHALLRDGVPNDLVRPVITGDVVRDWRLNEGDWALTPYDRQAELIPLDINGWGRRQWPFRAVLGGVTGFGGETRAEAGEPWWGWYRWVAQRYRTSLSVVFAAVATHNHFVFDRGRKAFNRTAPVIKLPKEATEDEHTALVGVLNSSTACFWLKQNSHDKGNRGGERSTARYAWENFYEFTGTTLQDYPLPAALPLERGRLLDELARELSTHALPAAILGTIPTIQTLIDTRMTFDRIQACMVAIQEELDWETYQLYGLIREDLTYDRSDLPGLALGQRSFEIFMANQEGPDEGVTAWFARHSSAPVTEIPAHWPATYRHLVQQRLDIIKRTRISGCWRGRSISGAGRRSRGRSGRSELCGIGFWIGWRTSGSGLMRRSDHFRAALPN